MVLAGPTSSQDTVERAATVLQPEQDKADHSWGRSRTQMAKTAQITLTEVAGVVVGRVRVELFWLPVTSARLRH